MENGTKVKIKLTEDFRGGQNSETVAKRGTVLVAVYVCPPPGVRGYSGYQLKRQGRIWYIPEAVVEVL